MGILAKIFLLTFVNFAGLIPLQDKEGKIAFIRERDIYVIDADGKNETKITEFSTDESPLFGPTWSPDGKKLLCSVMTAGKIYMFVIDSDGKNQKKILKSKGGNGYSFLSWSPDGAKIGFVIACPSGDEIWVMDVDGKNAKILTKGSFPAWSPNGKLLAFQLYENKEAKESIYVIDVDGTKLREIRKSEKWISTTMPVWLPDSKRIVFVLVNSSQLKSEICVIDVDGKNETKLVTAEKSVFHRSPSVSRDGKKIVFVREKGENCEIFTIQVSGEKLKQVVEIKGGRLSNPVWSPDGTKIAFVQTTEIGGGMLKDEIYIINSDGSDKKKIVQGTNPTWQPIAK